MAGSRWTALAFVGLLIAVGALASDQSSISSTGEDVERLPTATVGITVSDEKNEISSGMVATTASAQHSYVIEREDKDAAAAKKEQEEEGTKNVSLGAALSSMEASRGEKRPSVVQGSADLNDSPAAQKAEAAKAAGTAPSMALDELVAAANDTATVAEGADKAGEAASEGAEKAGEAASEGVEKAGEAAEKAGKAASEGVEKAGEAAEKAGEAASEGVEKAGEAVEKAGEATEKAGEAAAEAHKNTTSDAKAEAGAVVGAAADAAAEGGDEVVALASNIRCLTGDMSDCPKGYGCGYKGSNCSPCAELDANKRDACAKRGDDKVLKKIDPASLMCGMVISKEEDGKLCPVGYACPRKFKACEPCSSNRVKKRKDADCENRKTGVSLTKMPAPPTVEEVMEKAKALTQEPDDADHSDKDVAETLPADANKEGARPLSINNIICSGNGGCPKGYGCPDNPENKFCDKCADAFPDDTEKAATCESRDEFTYTVPANKIRCVTDDADCAKGFGCNREKALCMECSKVYKEQGDELIKRCRNRSVFTAISIPNPDAPEAKAENGTATGGDAADGDLPDPATISCKEDSGCPKGFACPTNADGSPNPDAKCDLCEKVYKDNDPKTEKCKTREDFLVLEPEKPRAEGAKTGDAGAGGAEDVPKAATNGTLPDSAADAKAPEAAGNATKPEEASAGDDDPDAVHEETPTKGLGGHATQMAHKECITKCLKEGKGKGKAPGPDILAAAKKCVHECMQKHVETPVIPAGAKVTSETAPGSVNETAPNGANATTTGEATIGEDGEPVEVPDTVTPEEEAKEEEKEEKSLETLANLDKEIDGGGDQKAAQTSDGQVVALARKDTEIKSLKDQLAELDRKIADARTDLEAKTKKLEGVENAKSPELSDARRELKSLQEDDDATAASSTGVAELLEPNTVGADLMESAKPEDIAAKKKELEHKVKNLQDGIQDGNVTAMREAVKAAQEHLDFLLQQREEMMKKLYGREEELAKEAGRDVGQDAAKEEEKLEAEVDAAKKEEQALDQQIKENKHKAATTKDPVQKEKIEQEVAKEIKESNDKKTKVDTMDGEMKDLRADVQAMANGQPPPRPKTLLPPVNNKEPDGKIPTKVDMGSPEPLIPLRLKLSGEEAESLWYDEDSQDAVAMAVTQSANADHDDAKVVWTEPAVMPANTNDKPVCLCVLLVTYPVAEHVMNSLASKDNHLNIVFKAIGLTVLEAEAGKRTVEGRAVNPTDARSIGLEHKDFPQHYTDLSMVDYSASGSWDAMWTMPESPANFVPKAPSLPPDLQATLSNDQAGAIIDVFYIHPTTYDSESSSNADIDDANVNTQSSMFVRYDATAFNGIARVYSPRFRQASKGALRDIQGETDGIFETAFTDVAAAFQFYWEHYNDGFGFIIAGHGQGAGLGAALLERVIDKSPKLRSHMVAAYLVGYFVPPNAFKKIPECTQANQINCYAAFVPVSDDGNPSDACGSVALTPYCAEATQMTPKTATPTCTNPLNWQSNGQAAATDNLGSGPGFGPYSNEYNDLTPGLVDARCDANGVLRINENGAVGEMTVKKFRSSPTGDYTLSAYSLFYMNIRQNAQQRADKYNESHPPDRKKRSAKAVKKQSGVDLKKVAKAKKAGLDTQAVSDEARVPVSGTGVSPPNSVAYDKNGIAELEENANTRTPHVIDTEVRTPVSLSTVAPGHAYYTRGGKVFVNQEFNENSAGSWKPLSLWLYVALFLASVFLLF